MEIELNDLYMQEDRLIGYIREQDIAINQIQSNCSKDKERLTKVRQRIKQLQDELKNNMSKAVAFAEKNTKRNSEGLAVWQED